MKQYIETWSSLSFFFLIFLSLAIFTLAQEVENQEEFNYIEGSPKGPENWGDIKEEWATCKTGRMQSPIDLPLVLRPQPAPDSAKIITSYRPGHAILKNRGHDIAVEWQVENSKITINGKDYILRQVHWHHPSEHSFSYNRCPLELHMVHQSIDNKIAVIGQPYFYGSPDPFLYKLASQLQQLIKEPTMKEVELGIIDPSEINIGRGDYYRYNGSLTTPPCDEGVIWTVSQVPKTVTFAQEQQLRDAVHDYAENNARPLQDRNGRQIRLYSDMICENPSKLTYVSSA